MITISRIVFLFCLCSTWGIGSAAFAGLAASDVVVVVNGESEDSRTLANYYVALRGIPSQNVIFLPEVPSSEVVELDDFRKKILTPVLEEIDRRGLAAHVQCIAYSTDFPTGVKVGKLMDKLGKLPKYFTRVASINAMTFFYQFVMTDDPGFVDFNANRYACLPVDHYFTSPAGAQSQEQWSKILDLVTQQRHAQAAAESLKLLADNPGQFPLQYLAAAEYAAAGDKENALSSLQKAIQAGWKDGTRLKGDSRFSALRSTSEFDSIQFLLEDNPSGLTAPKGFSAQAVWSPNGVRIKDPRKGYRYLLSIVLGVTRGQGTTLEEAIECLRRASKADYTYPEGTFYFADTKDVRTTSRKPGRAAAISRLGELGFSAKVIPTALPKDDDSVLGAQIGTPNFVWEKSASKFVPGAIADNLTSFGGVMTSPSQTKLSEFIRSGAAGSSGTVTEPYSIQAKFPHPMMYAYYAQGATLVEAFYLSVTSPYQLLIVGDPLCKPFSHAPSTDFGIKPQVLKTTDTMVFSFKQSVKRYLQWNLESTKHSQRRQRLAPVAVSMLTDGAGPKSGPISKRLSIKLNGLSPGYHELTMRLVADDPLAQRNDFVLPVAIDDPDLIRYVVPEFKKERLPEEMRLYGAANWYAATSEDRLKIQVSCSDAQNIVLYHEQEQLERVEGSKTTFAIKLDQFGKGPVRLWLKSTMSDGRISIGRPLLLNIK